MSTSQPSRDPALQQDESSQDDYPMMEAPDSPPDVHHPAANQSASLSSGHGTNGSRANGEIKTSHGAPGSTWNNKKWHDEYERANSQILDKDWDNTTFGDPLVK